VTRRLKVWPILAQAKASEKPLKQCVNFHKINKPLPLQPDNTASSIQKTELQISCAVAYLPHCTLAQKCMLGLVLGLSRSVGCHFHCTKLCFIWEQCTQRNGSTKTSHDTVTEHNRAL